MKLNLFLRLVVSGATMCAALLISDRARAASAEPAGHDHANDAKGGVYQCPMHPWIKSDKPGKCTICGMDLVAVDRSAATMPDGVVALSAGSITAIGVQSVPLAKQSLTRTLRVTGTIDDDDSRHRIIGARAEGRVDKLFVHSVGAVIRVGEPIYTLYSPELQRAQREFVQLARAGELAGSALPAARARLVQMGLVEKQIDELLQRGEPELVTPILAPDGGTVVVKEIYEGQWVKTGDRLLQVGDFAKMWFLFDAFEQDIPWLKLGLKVDLTTRAVPGEVITAPIEFIDPNFNEMTRTTKVRVVLPNPHIGANGIAHTLPHRVLADASVVLETAAVLAAPRAAVLDSGGGPVAYVDLGGNAYEQRALKLGRRGDDLVEVLSGLAEGEKVVTQGNLLIDAQAQLAREARGSAHSATSTTAMAQPTAPAMKAETSTAPSAPAAPMAGPAMGDLATLANAAIEAGDALASDDYVRYQKFFPQLATAAQGFSLPKLEVGDTLKAARRSFEPWSTQVADLLKPHREHLGVTVFQCPMSPVLGKGRWVQRSLPLKNPFFGSSMPDCGTIVH